MRMFCQFLVLTLTLALPLSVAAAEPRLPEFTATYTVSWNNISLGDATMTLKAASAPDCYVYESVTNPVGVVRMFYGSPHDVSEFCVSGGKVVPKKFQYIKSKGSDENFTLEFDMAKGKVRDASGTERDIPAIAQDRFGMHQAVRLWLLARLKEKDPGAEPYDVAQVDDKKIRQYRFAITGKETIEIPAGKFETILIQRVDDPKKTAKFWIAPGRDYMPVKVEQIRGSTEVRLQLKK
jgi:hypothetical protein